MNCLSLTAFVCHSSSSIGIIIYAAYIYVIRLFFVFCSLQQLDSREDMSPLLLLLLRDFFCAAGNSTVILIKCVFDSFVFVWYFVISVSGMGIFGILQLCSFYCMLSRIVLICKSFAFFLIILFCSLLWLLIACII